MAGNTKLRGFMANGTGLQLERWGKQVDVEVGADAIAKLRGACYEELPQSPPVPMGLSTRGFEVDYNSSSGRIVVELSPTTTHSLGVLLDFAKQLIFDREMSTDLQGELKVKLAISREIVTQWSESLRFALEEHNDYINVKDEPGIE